eukprot:6955467-Prorocentrum_lima.AAC.1
MAKTSKYLYKVKCMEIIQDFMVQDKVAIQFKVVNKGMKPWPNPGQDHAQQGLWQEKTPQPPPPPMYQRPAMFQ